ncbi:MAG TPA: ornithine cyclodeaminase family protein, partial [Myxococcales bacterium]|nr:ornithine cyclodeaminase family protein [Myxococcales bacterium]
GFIGDPSYVAIKVNGNFPNNPRLTGLPTIQGAIVLCDGRNGSLLAVIDSIEVTKMRTGAASAVAAKYLAQDNTKVATIIGCGIQGRVQLLLLLEVLPLKTAGSVG